jgi:hypothetical protein
MVTNLKPAWKFRSVPRHRPQNLYNRDIYYACYKQTVAWKHTYKLGLTVLLQWRNVYELTYRKLPVRLSKKSARASQSLSSKSYKVFALNITVTSKIRYLQVVSYFMETRLHNTPCVNGKAGKEDGRYLETLLLTELMKIINAKNANV